MVCLIWCTISPLGKSWHYFMAIFFTCHFVYNVDKLSPVMTTFAFIIIHFVFLNPSDISILSWNINTDRRVEYINGYAHYAFDGFTLKNRLNGIEEYLRHKNATIVSLCEVNPDYKEDIFNVLNRLGYKINCGACAPNQSPDMSFYLIEGYKEYELTLINSYMHWFTATPTIALKPENRYERQTYKPFVDSVMSEFQEEYERGSLISIYQRNNGSVFVHSMNHFGLRDPYKIKSCEILRDHLEEIRSHDENIGIVVSGDFNTFPTSVDAWDWKILSPLTNIGFCYAINGKTNTFNSYPYDLGISRNQKEKDSVDACLEKAKQMANKREIRELFWDTLIKNRGDIIKGALDHVLIWNINVKNCYVDLMDTVENLDMKKNTIEGIPSMLSDHLPTITVI